MVENLAPLSAFQLNAFQPNIFFLDATVTHDGHVSIRSEPHVEGVDANKARECYATIIPVKPGDHIVAKCWMKIDDGRPYDPFSGARIGIDLYNTAGGKNYILSSVHSPTYPDTDEGIIANYVHWGTQGWVQRTIDFIVPSDYFTHDYRRNEEIPTTQVNAVIMWMQVWSSTYYGSEPGNAWFADPELYINPTPEPPPSSALGLLAIAAVLLLGFALLGGD
jgi:hypothetical protein